MQCTDRESLALLRNSSVMRVFSCAGGHARGVNDIIGAFFDRLKHLPLQLYRLLQRAVQIIGKRMLAARLFETVDQHRVRGIEKQDLIFPFFPALMLPLR